MNEVTALDCAGSDITDLTGLEDLTSLQTLDLTDNPGILCTDLDALETALPSTIITRPVPCDAGGGGVQASQVQALHNALGQRVIKTVNGDPNSTIHFLYDQAGQVIAEIDATTGATLREYLYVNGQQLAIVDDTGTAQEQTYFVHNDHLGTPQKITDASQQIVWNATYKPFGEVEVTTADIENNIRFPGQYADEETGLHYNYFRDYDPSLGRYVESDPIGINGSANSYGFAENRMGYFVDLNGLEPTNTWNAFQQQYSGMPMQQKLNNYYQFKTSNLLDNSTRNANNRMNRFGVVDLFNDFSSFICLSRDLRILQKYYRQIHTKANSGGTCSKTQYQINAFEWSNGCLTDFQLRWYWHEIIGNLGWIIYERGEV